MALPATLERIGNPRRAIIGSAALLALTTGLAGWLSAGRHSLSLSARVTPPGWPVSFEPPTGWKLAERKADRWEYRDMSDADRPRQLVVKLYPRPAHWSAADVASQVMNSHLAPFVGLEQIFRLGNSGVEPEEAPLGRLPGARIDMPETGDFVHAGLLPGEDEPAVVVQYHVHGPFSERDRRTARLVAASVE